MTILRPLDWLSGKKKSHLSEIRLIRKRMQSFSFGYFDFEIILRQPDGNMPIISGLKQ